MTIISAYSHRMEVEDIFVFFGPPDNMYQPEIDSCINRGIVPQRHYRVIEKTSGPSSEKYQLDGFGNGHESWFNAACFRVVEEPE